jgi:hypothetical protein
MVLDVRAGSGHGQGVSTPTWEVDARAARRWSMAAAAGISLIAAPAAQAYLDGGSGSMMLQLLLGGLAGVGVVARLYWHRFVGLFGRRRQDPAPVGADEQDPKV